MIESNAVERSFPSFPPQARRLRGTPRFNRQAVILAILGLCLLFASPAIAKKEKKKELTKAQAAAIEALPEKYRQWLQNVDLIIAKDEKAAFLELDKDYQRDAFIERFWKARDPYPRTARNEYRDSYMARLDQIRLEFAGPFDERSTIYLLNGPPTARIETECPPYLWPLEVWYYDGSDAANFEYFLLFYRRFGGKQFRLWEPFDGVQDLSKEPNMTVRFISDRCGEDGRAIVAAISYLTSQGGAFGAATLISRLKQPPETPNAEWINTFSTYSTDLPDDAGTFESEFRVDYPGRRQNRTVVQGAFLVSADQLTASTMGAQTIYSLLLNGEILREGKLHENFRYRFDLPQSELADGKIPLVFQRYVRAGDYVMIAKLEDVGSGKFHRIEQEITVPKLEAEPPPPADPETARILAEAHAAIKSGENTLKLAPLLGEWQTGLVRIETLITGDDFDKVTFFLDGDPILTKRRPPFNVELDLGQVPRARILRIEGYDEAGNEIAADETMINAGTHRFAVRLIEPRRGKTYRQSLQAQTEVIVPEGESIERLEYYLNETLISTLYQPPWIQPVILPQGEELAYVRAVAYAPDGNSTEDLVFVNAPANLEEIDVDFVELFTAVLDKGQRPVEGLQEEDFTVLEDGVAQELVRFELVRDLPIRVAVMLDVSASMEDEMADAQDAVLGFFQQTIQPKDRATFITFNDHPNLVTKFTNDLGQLSAGLAGLKAERGTSLYDSIIFTLYYFNGLRGQRALLLLSDGKDESSKFEFDDALEYCRRAGVSLYTIGLKLSRKDMDARRKLNRLADETGGRSFFVEDSSELPAIYDIIQQELRSRYLLAYQSSNTSDDKRFRAIEVELSEKALEAKTLRGYYP